MLAGNASRSQTRRRGTAAFALTLAAVTLSGCYHNPDPTEWNAAAKTNFINGCSVDVSADKGTTTSVAVADKSTCECIYDLIKAPEDAEKGKYPIEWSALKEYEAKQADAKAGDAPPTPPKNLTKAIDECKVEGPGI